MLITIPTPCNQDWDAMTPTGQGRHCVACQKVVVDFSRMTDGELVAWIQDRAGQEVCGRLEKGQVGRELTPALPLVRKHPWWSWARVSAAAGVLWLVLAGKEDALGLQRVDRGIAHFDQTAEARAMNRKAGYDVVQFLKKHLRYPKEAGDTWISGRVYVQFHVSKNGSLSQFTVLKGLGYGTDEEALRLVASMPRWKASQSKGYTQTVEVYFDPEVMPAPTEEPTPPLQKYEVIVMGGTNVIVYDEKVPDYTIAVPQELFSQHYFQNIQLPQEVQQGLQSGEVLVGFEIKKNGKISKAKKIKGLSKACDQEALRLVRSQKPYFPAMLNKRAVASKDSIAVPFWRPE